MTELILANEAALRLGCFVGVLAAMLGWEHLAPRRHAQVPRLRRWPGNLALVGVNTLLLRAVFPAAAVGVAAFAESRGLGLFNRVELSGWVSAPLSILLLDLAIYGQHVAFHRIPALWRLHRMHHTDLEFDVTTGVRFHPLEILLSMLIKAAVILALGAPVIAVLLFEILLNSTSLFNHGNARMPRALDRRLRRLIVTPDMHRVHHSIDPRETDSNFGFSLSWWDRLFRTYRDQPAAGHTGMTIGIAQFRDPGELRLDRMLLQPLLGGEATGREVNR